MEWVDRMNSVIEYLEANPTEPVNTDTISRLMACPYAVFARSFAPISGLTLTEYVRRRRLSAAACELQSTDLRVLDVAVKYGYDSADAFAAAFKRMHGITPQDARKADAPLQFYPRLTFTLMVAGVQALRYRAVERAAFQVLGIRRTTPQGGGTWALVKADGTAERLAAIAGHACDLGLCFGFDAQGHNDYLCGVAYAGLPLPGFDVYAYPATTFLVFTAEGSIRKQALGETWKRIYGEFMPQSPYRQVDLPTIEQYLQWDEGADHCLVDIWVPVQAP